jgi:hypothetical protein
VRKHQTGGMELFAACDVETKTGSWNKKVWNPF